MLKYLGKRGAKFINVYEEKNKTSIILKRFTDKFKNKSVVREEKILLNLNKGTFFNKRNEIKDNLNATKLEQENTQEEDIRPQIDEINIDMSEVREEKEKRLFKEIKGNTLEIFHNKFDVDISDYNQFNRQLYENLVYSIDIDPKIQKLKENGFTENYHIKVLVQKRHNFFIGSFNIDKFIYFKEFLKKLVNFSDAEVCDNLICIPNILELTDREVEINIHRIKEYFNIVDESELKKLLNEYPIFITNFTSDPSKIELYFNLYLEMSKEEFRNYVSKFPLLLITSPDNVFIILKSFQRYKLEKKTLRAVLEKNPKVFLFKPLQITNVISALTKLGFTSTEVIKLIIEYPEILISNRHSLLTKKISLFGDMKMNKATIKNLIKKYPFILLKSYNSFINKVFYFKQELNQEIEKIDIYPLIFAFNLDKDIIPRCEMMKSKKQWLPYNEAFSMTCEELAKKLNFDQNQIVKPIAQNIERDIFFRYSKYYTI